MASQPTRRRVLQQLGATGLVLRGVIPGLSGCKGESGDTGSGERFYFAVITDLHIKDDPTHPNNEVLARTVEILNGFEVPLDFVLVTGDVLDDLPSDDPAYYEEHTDTAFEQAAALFGALDMPAHLVMGNHDYYLSDGMDSYLTDDLQAREAVFLARMGVPDLWYRFDHQGIAFIGLNSMQQDARVSWTPGSCGSFGEEQLAWLEEQLSQKTPCFLFFHHPLALDNAVQVGATAYRPFEIPRAEGNYEKYEGTEYEGWTDPIYDILARHKDHILAIFVGHTHWFVRDEYEGMSVMMTDSVGNSLQDTARGEGEDADPMRYHIVECDLTHGTFAVYNSDWFTYNL